jgi:hypothetical protein
MAHEMILSGWPSQNSIQFIWQHKSILGGKRKCSVGWILDVVCEPRNAVWISEETSSWSTWSYARLSLRRNWQVWNSQHGVCCEKLWKCQQRKYWTT